MLLKKVGVLGAGTSGMGIIRTLAGCGVDVTFCEISEQKVQETMDALSEALDREITRYWVTGSEKRLILTRIHGTTDVRNMAGVQIVIDCIPGDIEDKQNLFQELDAIFPEDTVLVTNSATLCVSDIARKAEHPDRIAAMHFSLPVPRRPVVEIVKGRKTSEKAMQTVRALAKTMKKRTFEVFEMPGLITSRVMIPYINEAMHIVMEGLAEAEQVDEAIRLGFSLPIGPLAMADRIGLDRLYDDMERLFKALGDQQYRPCPLLRRMVREGRLGVKSGRGFFTYDETNNGV